MANGVFKLVKDEEIFEKLFTFGQSKGMAEQDAFPGLLDLSSKAGEIASGVYMDLLMNYSGREHIGDVSCRMCAYGGMLAVYLMIKKPTYMKNRDLLSTLIKPRGATELDDNALNQIGIKPSSLEAKTLNRHFQEVADIALKPMAGLNLESEYFGDQLLECLMAMFNYGVCLEMNRLQGV